MSPGGGGELLIIVQWLLSLGKVRDIETFANITSGVNIPKCDGNSRFTPGKRILPHLTTKDLLAIGTPSLKKNVLKFKCPGRKDNVRHCSAKKCRSPLRRIEFEGKEEPFQDGLNSVEFCDGSRFIGHLCNGVPHGPVLELDKDSR